MHNIWTYFQDKHREYLQYYDKQKLSEILEFESEQALETKHIKKYYKLQEEYTPRYDFVIKYDWHNMFKYIEYSSASVLLPVHYLENNCNWPTVTIDVDEKCAAYLHCDGNESVHGTATYHIVTKEGINKFNLESVALCCRFSLYYVLQGLRDTMSTLPIFSVIMEYAMNVNVSAELRKQRDQEIIIEKLNHDHVNTKIIKPKNSVIGQKRNYEETSAQPDTNSLRRSKRLNSKSGSYAAHPLDPYNLDPNNNDHNKNNPKK